MRFLGRRSGFELGYAEITADFGSAAQTTPAADITGLSITVTADGTNPVELVFWGMAQKQANAGTISVLLYEGATFLCSGTFTAGAVNEITPLVVSKRFVPTAGSHTYNAKLSLGSVGGRLIGSAQACSYIAAIQR